MQKHSGASIPADLRAVIEAWDTLPEAVKAGILAMIRATDAGLHTRQNRTDRADPGDGKGVAKAKEGEG